jgi:hypothetical protein
MRRIGLAALVVTALLLLVPEPASAAATTPCDGLPDTEVPADAHIGDFGTIRFLADIDGDGLRDVVTGYWLGDDPDLGPHFLHAQLASGWGTQYRTDTIPDITHPINGPRGIVVIGGKRLIPTAVQRNANFGDIVFFAFENCALTPILDDGGTYPDIIYGGGFTHREWFTCRDDGVEMIETLYGHDENQEIDQSVFDQGSGTFFRLDPGGFFVEEGPVALNLPRSVEAVFDDFPICPPYMGTFADDDDSLFQTAIEWMALERLTTGCNAPASTRYCPDEELSRGEMAAFLVRAEGYTDDGGGDLFVDDDDSRFESAIDRLGAAGVTKGCNPPANDRFCPDRPVTRGEMAGFLVRAYGYGDDGGGNHFTDDDESVFEAAIDRLFTAGITKGCDLTGDLFCPQDPVTRGQMAAFLMRANS